MMKSWLFLFAFTLSAFADQNDNDKLGNLIIHHAPVITNALMANTRECSEMASGIEELMKTASSTLATDGLGIVRNIGLAIFQNDIVWEKDITLEQRMINLIAVITNEISAKTFGDVTTISINANRCLGVASANFFNANSDFWFAIKAFITDLGDDDNIVTLVNIYETYIKSAAPTLDKRANDFPTALAALDLTTLGHVVDYADAREFPEAPGLRSHFDNARNAIITKSAEFINFINDDDVWHGFVDYFLNEVKNTIKDTQLNVLIPRVQVTKPKKEEFRQSTPQAKQSFFDYMKEKGKRFTGL